MDWFLVRPALLVLSAVPFVYYLFATASALAFFRRSDTPRNDFLPPVSVLKPVRGLDREAYENLVSFFLQEYPSFEILFAVSDENDPAVPLIRTVIRDFPAVPARLLMGAPALGTCDKVNKLVRLASEAKHDIVVISDSDIRVAQGYLRAIAAPFADSRAGAATCLYRGMTDGSLGADLEALGNSSDFDAGVLAAWALGKLDFALGATVATTKGRLAEIGGFESLVNYFGDDYELGNRISQRGHPVKLIQFPVATVFPKQTLADSLRHQIRWYLTMRCSRPLGHLSLLLTHGLPWTVLAATIAPSSIVALAYVATYILLRGAMAWTVGVRGIRDPLLRRKLWMLPARDAFAFLAWMASFFKHQISWRGQRFTIRDKQLVPVVSAGRR